MHDTACWTVVEKCHDTALNDMALKCQLIHDAVSKLSECDATDFVRWFDATMARACNWGLWGALKDPDSLADVAGDIESWFREGYG